MSRASDIEMLLAAAKEDGVLDEGIRQGIKKASARKLRKKAQVVRRARKIRANHQTASPPM